MWNKPSKTKQPDNAAEAYDYAVFLLSLSLRTVGEVREKMTKRGYSPATIGGTIKRLTDQKYLDDERYAEVFLENLKTYKNFGYYGIKKKFIEKKLPPDVIGRTLEEGLSQEEELKIAKRFLKKEGFTVKDKPEDVEEAAGLHYHTYDEASGRQWQKITQKLKSRGFRGEVIARLVL